MTRIPYKGQQYSIVFTREDVVRVEATGLEVVEQVKAMLFAEGQLKAVGFAHKSPRDFPDSLKGSKIALGRAVNTLTKGDKKEQTKFFRAFNDALRVTGEVAPLEQLDAPQEPAVLQTELPSANAEELAGLERSLARNIKEHQDKEMRLDNPTELCPACNYLREQIDKLKGLTS